MAVVIGGAAVGAYELALLGAAALAAVFLASPPGQQAVKNTAQAISDLAQPADESDAPATPDAVQDCPYAKDDTNDKCKEIYQQIYEAVNVVQSRINDLLDDKLDLYNQAFDTPNPNLPPNSGTWLGHITQAQGWQNRLKNLIARAEAMGCPVPPDIKQLAYRDLPSQPRGNYPGRER